jgi:hypothetical protein
VRLCEYTQPVRQQEHATPGGPGEKQREIPVEDAEKADLHVGGRQPGRDHHGHRDDADDDSIDSHGQDLS